MSMQIFLRKGGINMCFGGQTGGFDIITLIIILFLLGFLNGGILEVPKK